MKLWRHIMILITPPLIKIIAYVIRCLREFSSILTIWIF